MRIADIIEQLEMLAPPDLQEEYDNAGLLTGDPSWECTGALVCLDSIEAVIDEALSKKINLVIAHHPIIFKGLKRISGKNYVGRTIIKAIKNDIAIYAIHTNLDNVIQGVNGKIADTIGLRNLKPLLLRENQLKKLHVFVPKDHTEKVRNAIFSSGGGQIGDYSECSFNTEGYGTYKPGEGADPFAGNIGKRHKEEEIKVEVIYPAYLEKKIVDAMIEVHPYEEVAFDLVPVGNSFSSIGAGLVGELSKPLSEKDFIGQIKQLFGSPVVRHTALRGEKITKVAVCGGAGSFLISKAIGAGADAFVSADLKYHEFFDADNRLLILDIGHYESEHLTINLLHEFIAAKFPTFAVLKTEVNTNPVQYFF